MKNYTLSAEETSQFGNDEFRSALRSRLTNDYPEGVLVLTPDGDLIDTIASPDGEIELASIIPPEEAEERAAERERLKELELQEVYRLETVIRPQVISKLKAEVRGEFRDQIRELTNEKLELKASFARLQRDSASSTQKLRSELSLKTSELTRTQEEKLSLLEKVVQLESDLNEARSEPTESES